MTHSFSIEVCHIYKNFQQHWVIRDWSQIFTMGHTYAIIGENGSGKTTLLEMIAGFVVPTKGNIRYNHQNVNISVDSIYQFIAYCSPTMQLIEEMTAIEFLHFHHIFKPFTTSLTPNTILKKIQLDRFPHKKISQFSSGMKQRLKLAQAIFSSAPILIMDEPCTNLDEQNIHLYHSWIKEYTAHKIIIIASNNPIEYNFCNHILSISKQE